MDSSKQESRHGALAGKCIPDNARPAPLKSVTFISLFKQLYCSLLATLCCYHSRRQWTSYAAVDEIVIWVYFERKEGKSRAQRTVGTGTSQFDDWERYTEMVWTRWYRIDQML